MVLFPCRLRTHSSCAAVSDRHFRKTWPKEPEDRIEASLVGLAEGWPEDVDRLSNNIPLPKTAVPMNYRFRYVRAEGDDAVFLKRLSDTAAQELCILKRQGKRTIVLLI